jgi:hypothetical protein
MQAPHASGGCRDSPPRLLDKALDEDYITPMIRNEQNARDVQIINQRADYLNEEAADVLAYQVAL